MSNETFECVGCDVMGVCREHGKRNRARCKFCEDVIESTERHELVRCKCGAIFVDGGMDYARRGGNLAAFEDVYE